MLAGAYSRPTGETSAPGRVRRQNPTSEELKFSNPILRFVPLTMSDTRSQLTSKCDTYRRSKPSACQIRVVSTNLDLQKKKTFYCRKTITFDDCRIKISPWCRIRRGRLFFVDHRRESKRENSAASDDEQSKLQGLKFAAWVLLPREQKSESVEFFANEKNLFSYFQNLHSNYC